MKENCIWTPGSLHGDEYYTTQKVAEQVANHILNIPHLKVWCPFNDVNSVWGGELTKKGFDVVCTDTDFFNTDPPDKCQAIISNPPFSLKNDVMERTKNLGLRFAYILPFTWLNDSKPLEYGYQLMLFRKRMHFNTPDRSLNKPRSNCFVLSDGLLKSDLITIWE